MFFKSKFFFLCFLHFICDKFYLPYNKVFIILFGLVLIPQIKHNMQFQSVKFNFLIVFQYIFPRLCIFIYYRIIPFNLKNFSPFRGTALISILIYFLISFVLYRQSTKNVFWFVPKCLRKKQYNYLVPKFKLQKEKNDLEKPLKLSKLGFFNKLFRKFSFIFSKNKINKEFSKKSLKVINLQESNEYGEISTNSVLSDQTVESDCNDVEDQSNNKLNDIQKNSQFSEKTCSICLNCILDTENIENQEESEYSNQIFKEYSSKYNQEYIMKTPCNHEFHIGKKYKYL